MISAKVSRVNRLTKRSTLGAAIICTPANHDQMAIDPLPFFRKKNCSTNERAIGMPAQKGVLNKLFLKSGKN
jgi:hypothetical protein